MPAPENPAEQLAFCTTRIESHYLDGTRGIGTGFFFNLFEDAGKSLPVIVSNRHVVEGASYGEFKLSTCGPDKGSPTIPPVTITVENFAARWIFHPDKDIDLCVMPIGPLVNQAKSQGIDFFYTIIFKELLPTEEEISEMVGFEEVVMVGYPQGIWDEVNNRPIFRRGILASDFRYDWNGKREFLIDVACFPGSSGSPIFLYNPTGYMTRSGPVIRSRLKLLGILSRGPQFTATGEIKIVDVPTQQKPIAESLIPMNLGIAIKIGMLCDFQANLPGLLAGLLARNPEA